MFRCLRPARTCVGVLALLAAGTVAGCGGGVPPAAAVAATSSSNLRGNWLLAGPLPTAEPAFGNGSAFGLAADFNVFGDQVFGALSQAGTCANGVSLSNAGFVVGNIAANGSFTLQTPALPSGTPPVTVVTIQGTVPQTAGAGWTGTYTITGPSESCPSSLSGAITATPIPLLAGTFAGTANLQISGSLMVGSTVTAPVPTPVTVTLQQSAMDSTGASTPAESFMPLTGSIAFGGSSCLSSGSTTGATGLNGISIISTVAGNSISAVFAMNDGSSLQMFGSISSLDASKITVQFSSLSNGTCPAQFAQFTTLSH